MVMRLYKSTVHNNRPCTQPKVPVEYIRHLHVLIEINMRFEQLHRTRIGQDINLAMRLGASFGH